METIGVYLRKGREAKQIDLSDVSRQTKISRFYLEYIENNEFEKLPQGPYIKGYITAYAKLIGSDVYTALKLYEAFLNNDSDSQALERDLPATNEVAAPNPGNGAKQRGLKRLKWSPSAQVEKWGAALRAAAIAAKARYASWKPAVPSLNTVLRPFKPSPESLRAGFASVAATVTVAGQTAQAAMRATARWAKRSRPLLHQTGDALRAVGLWVKDTAAAVAANRRLFNRRAWLFGFSVMAGCSILVLAGVGAYHLFVFDNHPAMVAEAQLPKAAEPLASPVMKEPPPPSSMTALKAQFPTIPNRAYAATSAASQPAEPAGTPPVAAAPESKDAVAKLNGSPVAQQAAVADSPAPVSAMSAVNLSVSKASVGTGISNRVPVGVDTVFPASVDRIYVWSQVEAKQFPSKIRHIYYFKDWKISDVALDVRSSNWRTWSYKTISSDRYRGPWRVDITSDGGKILRRLHFEVK